VRKWHSETVYNFYYWILIIKEIYQMDCSRWLVIWLDFCLQTWMYLAVPILLYASERTLRLFRSGLYTVRLIKVSIGSEMISGRLLKLVST
jgi:respiratory burst oxidase